MKGIQDFKLQAVKVNISLREQASRIRTAALKEKGTEAGCALHTIARPPII